MPVWYDRFRQSAKTLTIGDVLDKDITGTALNYVKDKLSLSDFKGKAIVIDFWATTCGPRVAELPKLDSLCNRFIKMIYRLFRLLMSPRHILKIILKREKRKP